MINRMRFPSFKYTVDLAFHLEQVCHAHWLLGGSYTSLQCCFLPADATKLTLTKLIGTLLIMSLINGHNWGYETAIAMKSIIITCKLWRQQFLWHSQNILRCTHKWRQEISFPYELMAPGALRCLGIL